MGLCVGEVKKRRPFKTIIIPRGLINPYEHNVIEIPFSLDGTDSLIVKAPNDASACFSVEPYNGGGPNYNLPSRYASPQPTYSAYMDCNPMICKPTTSFPEPSNTGRNITWQNDKPLRACSSVKSNVLCGKPSTSEASCQAYPSNVCFERPTTSCFQQPIQTRPCYQEALRTVPCFQDTIKTSPCFQEAMKSVPCFQEMKAPESHSPFCPICSKASCKYLSGLGHPCGIRSYLAAPCIDPFNICNPPRSTFGETCSYRPSFSPRESFCQSRARIENEALNRILDEKIDKILKPVLYSLAKFSPEDEESEINQRCLTSCPSRYRGEQFVPRKSEDVCLDDARLVNDASSCELSYRRQPESDSKKQENYKTNGNLGTNGHSSKQANTENNDQRRGSLDANEEPPNLPGRKRSSVSFFKNKKKSDLKTNEDKTLDKNPKQSGGSTNLAPRSSF